MEQASRRDKPPSSHRAAFWGYVGTVSASGVLLLALGIAHLASQDVTGLATSPGFWIVTALVVFGELRPIFAAGLPDPNGVTPSTTFAFAALIGLGVVPAALLQALAASITGIIQGRAWFRIVFNVGQYTVSMFAAWAVLAAFGDAASPGSGHTLDSGDILPTALAGLAYFLANNLLVSQAIALIEGGTAWTVFRADIVYQTVVNASLLGISPLVAVVLNGPWAFLPLSVLPLVAIYLTAQLSLEREQQALHDGLTGLANRKLLTRRAAEEIREARKRGAPLALLVLDLDRFKEINDTLGHPSGDRVLTTVAERLRACLRPEDEVARLGGDEFAVLLPGINDAAAACEVARRLHESLEIPFDVDGFLIDVGASTGIALCPQHGEDYDVLFARADVAMYLAKEEGTGIEVYDASRDRNSPERLSLLGALRRAPDHDELELHFQPKMDLATGQVCGVEALVRWRHPSLGLLMPSAFVPVAEQYGLTGPLTDKVLGLALDQLVRWRAEGIELPVAVNVSARDLRDSTFPGRVQDALQVRGLVPESLHVEVTESAFTADLGRIQTVLDDLAALGVRLSLDDFGTGYSSLTRLRTLPFHEVKIDQSFVARVAQQGEDATIVRSVIELGHGLGMVVVAEGVETAATLDLLVRLGCDIGQGYHFAVPMDAEATTGWLRRRIPALDPRD